MAPMFILQNNRPLDENFYWTMSSKRHPLYRNWAVDSKRTVTQQSV